MKWPRFSFGSVDWWACGLIEFLQVCPTDELAEWLVEWLMKQSHFLTKRLVKQAVHWVAKYLVASHLLQRRRLDFCHSLMDCSSPNVAQLNRRRFACFVVIRRCQDGLCRRCLLLRNLCAQHSCANLSLMVRVVVRILVIAKVCRANPTKMVHSKETCLDCHLRLGLVGLTARTTILPMQYVGGFVPILWLSKRCSAWHCRTPTYPCLLLMVATWF